MRIVYRAENLIDAHLVKDVLDRAGIPCFVNGEYLIGGVGQLPARDFVSVSVPAICVEAAEPLVREAAAILGDARAAAADDAPNPLAINPATA